MKVKVILLEEMLGTCSGDPEIHKEFIASKAPDAMSTEQEVEALGVDGVIEKAKTVFPRSDGVPFLWDYQIKGFFKDACGMLTRSPGTESSKIRAYKKIIDGLVFVQPRKILLELPEGSKIGDCQRPLRASGPQGERVALANSETVPEGTTFVMEIVSYKIDGGKTKADLQKAIREWLDYGQQRGLGQWRNSGKGRYTYQILD